MESYPVSFLIGTPHLDEMQLEQEAADDRRAASECERAADDAAEAKAAAELAAFPWSDGGGDPEPTPPAPAGALFPEIYRWSDDVLIVAVGEADARHPGMNLHAVGNLPDRHEAFIAEATAELLRRMDARAGVARPRMAA